MKRDGLTRFENVVLLFIITMLAVVFFPCHPCSMKISSARRFACANNLKQLGLMLDLYASENGNRYPPIDQTKNNFIFDGNIVYPDYLIHVSPVSCPADPGDEPERNFRLRSVESHPGFSVGDPHSDCISDRSYCYLGWEIASDEEAGIFFKAYGEIGRAHV